MDNGKDIKELNDKELDKVSGGIGAYNHPIFVVNAELCIGCATCEKDCPTGSIHFDSYLAVIDQSTCIQCACCSDACPTGAIRMEG